MKEKEYRRNLFIGWIGAFFMWLGDLSLSLIAPCDTDQGLFLREAYLNGSYALWRPVFLLVTGMVGVYGYWYGMKSIRQSLRGHSEKWSTVFEQCSMIYCFTGLMVHFAIGIGSYITSYVAVQIGREEAIAMIGDFTGRFFPAIYIVYLPMAFLYIYQFVMLVRGKTIYSKRMLLFCPLLWMAVCALIPDIRQLLHCHLVTLDYAITQGSGNFACMLYFAACLLLPDKWKLKA